MININDFKLTEFPDGSVCLNCGDGMTRDLIFAFGAMSGDPDLKKQKEILEFIIKSIQFKRTNSITPEQKARDLLERMEVPNAQDYTAGELVELANLFTE